MHIEKSTLMKISSLAALVELDRVNYAAGVRTYWRGLEQELTEPQKEINAKLAGLLKADPEAAARYATDSADSIARSALNKAGIMRNELLAFIASRGASETVRAPYTPSFAAAE